jgi:outer membrane lipoprotein-sorting protein
MLAFWLLVWSLPVAARADARTVVREIESHYRSVKTLEGVFLETYREGQRILRIESGRVYFLRPRRMRWEYESPETKLFLADGKRVWFYVPADHTVSRAPMKESPDWRTPFALLTGKVRLSELCSRVARINSVGGGRPDARLTAAGDVLLSCIPRGEAKPEPEAPFASSDAGARPPPGGIHEILIEADAAGQIVRVVIEQPGEIETEIRFGDWKENVPLAEALFHFEPPAGVAIVDEPTLAGWSR